MMIQLKSKAGQSTVEYILLVTAVVAVMIFFATNRNTGIQQRLENSYNAVGDDMTRKAVTLNQSHTSPDGAPAVIPAAQRVTIPTRPQIQ